MEREKHYQEKHGNGPNHHHYHEGTYNKHAGTHCDQKEKGKEVMKFKYKHDKNMDHKGDAFFPKSKDV